MHNGKFFTQGYAALTQLWGARPKIVAVMAFAAGSAWFATSGAAAGSAEDLVRDTTSQVLEAFRADEGLAADRPRLYDFVDRVVLQHFDFTRMSRKVLGKHWAAASTRQQEQFVEGLSQLVIRTYSTALVNYRNQEISVQAGSVRGDITTVKMTISRPGAPPLPITYTMTKVGGAWKVFDVTIDGVSLVITFRSAFGQEVRRAGMDGLLQQLKQHTGSGA